MINFVFLHPLLSLSLNQRHRLSGVLALSLLMGRMFLGETGLCQGGGPGIAWYLDTSSDEAGTRVSVEKKR